MDPDPDFRFGSGFLADPDPDSEKRSDPDLDPGKKPGSETLKNKYQTFTSNIKMYAGNKGLETQILFQLIFFIYQKFSVKNKYF